MERTDLWNQSFDGLLAYISAEKGPEKPASLIIHAAHIQPFDMRAEAEHEIWGLFEKALQTLKADSRSDTTGDLALASSMASLRRTKLAESLNVAPPKFVQDDSLTVGKTADDRTAFDLIKIMMEAAQNDLQESRDILIDALNFSRTRDAELDNKNAAELRLLEKFLKAGNKKDPNDVFQGEAVHRQMALTLRAQITAYKSIHSKICDQVAKVAPTKDWAPIVMKKSSSNAFKGFTPR